MRIGAPLALFVLALVSVPAIARGGGGGALADALVYLMGVAIVVGVPTGLAMASVRWMRVLVTLLVVLGAIIIAITQRWTRWLFGIPLATFAVICTSACVWARTPGRPDIPDGVRWVAGTHLFWAVFALINLKVLAALALPPLLLFTGKFVVKFLPFVLPPLALAFAVAVFASRLVYRRRSDLGPRVRPMIFNAILLLAFLASAEGYKGILIQTQLSGKQPDCVSSHSFVSALSQAGNWFGTSHGYFEEAGKRHHWSYSERRFVEAAPGHTLFCTSRSHASPAIGKYVLAKLD